MRHDRPRLAPWTGAPSLHGVVEAAGRDRQRRHDQRGVVLLGAVDAVRELIVGVDLIELGRWLIVLRAPGATAVERDVGAAVVRLDHDPPVGRIDPQVVVVAVWDAHAREGPAAIDALEVALGAGVDDVGVGRVGGDRGVVEGAGAELRIVGDQRERAARVVGAVEARAGLRLDQNVDAVGVGATHRDVRLADESGGEAIGELRPGGAAVGALVDAAFHGAGDDRPGLPFGAPHGRVDDVRITGIELHVDRAGRVTHMERTGPGAAAVGGAVHAACVGRAERVADRGHECDARVGGMHAHRADVADVLEADVRPRLARVARLPDALADRDVGAEAVRAGARVDDVRVGVGDIDVAHGADGDLPVGDVRPVGAGVGGLPDAATGGAEVEGVGFLIHARHRSDATAACGADHAPAELVERRWRGDRRDGRGDGRRARLGRGAVRREHECRGDRGGDREERAGTGHGSHGLGR